MVVLGYVFDFETRGSSLLWILPLPESNRLRQAEHIWRSVEKLDGPWSSS
jgi:hypothetical protein